MHTGRQEKSTTPDEVLAEVSENKENAHPKGWAFLFMAFGGMVGLGGSKGSKGLEPACRQAGVQ